MATERRGRPDTTTPVLLSGGNPQVPKADGDGPVQAYIAAMPGWKRTTGQRLDALIVRNAPGVRKAVKWNSPMYGMEGQGFFVSFHVFTRYVKVTFFRGTLLRPVPPGGTGAEARWIDIHEDDFDEAQMAKWVKQAASHAGWAPGQPAPSARKTVSTKKAPSAGGDVSPKNDQHAGDIGGWRRETLARMRALILEADPAVVEERKWAKPSNPAGVPVWSHGGIICTGETYKSVVKLTFARGASLPDPAGLFNSSLDGKTRRAIDIREGQKIDARAFKALVKAAVAENKASAKEAPSP